MVEHWTENLQSLPKKVVELEDAAAQRHSLDKMLLRLYYGRPIAVPAVDASRPAQALASIEGARAGGINLTRQVIDAAASLVVRIPAIKCVPVGTHFSKQRAAKLQGRFCNGVFYANDIDRRSDRVWTGGATTRLGGTKWYVDPQTKAIKSAPVNSLNLFWDDAEGPDPRNLYEVTAVPKRFLAAKYPKHADVLLKAPLWAEPTVSMVDPPNIHERETAKVIEAWSLPMGKEPGKHVIVCGDVTLLEEKWEFERFPIALFRWQDSFRSFGGRPLAEILMPYQLWTNKLTRVIDEAQKGAVPMVLEHEMAEIAGLTDRPFQRVRYRGQIPPQVITPQGLNAEIYNWRETLKREAFEEGGVNMALAQGTKPAGLTSAVALREHQDIASTRLIRATKRFEAYFKDSAEIILMLARQAYHNKGTRVTAPDTDHLEEIDWDAIKLGEDESAVQVESVSALPLTVAGRLDFVKELMAEQLISPKDGLRLLQIPDTEAELDRQTAPQDLAARQVEAALWDGEYLPPESIQDLDLLIGTASLELQRALQNTTYPAENLELCRRLIAEAKLLKDAGAAPPTTQPTAAAPASDQGSPTEPLPQAA